MMTRTTSSSPQHVRIRLSIFLLTLLAAAVSGCAVNPVTGKNELALVSQAQEIQVGEQQYGLLRQMSGGDYVVNPEISEYVQDVGNRLAQASRRQLPYEFVVINDSTPNAWALPGGKIAIHRDLLTELNSEAELAAVMGHEIVHADARHGAQAMQRGMLLQGAAVAAAVTAEQSDYGSLLMTAAGVGLQLINQRYGRDAERESDRYGMLYMAEAGYNPAAAVELQETFLRLSEGRPSDWLSGLFASHPPSAERVQNNRETLAELNISGGEFGRERYRAVMAPLTAAKAAYAAHDRGRAALVKGDTAAALAAAREALAIEPREAHFHSLRGDVRAAQGRWSDALINYNRAVTRNSAYFYPLMRRGLVHQRLQDNAAAAVDLERSIDLLPSAPALNALGEIRLAGGQRADALELFRAAAKSDSPSGRAAADSLVRLELPEKPYLYLKLAIGRNAAGQLAMEISNPTSVDVEMTQLAFQFRDAGGNVRESSRAVRQTLPAGQRIVATLNPTWIGGVRDPQQVRGGVTAAKIVQSR
ncbi:MAG: M48 family metalloprotease [Gammaproteobacteria bacterium]|nr:M48 family metalloprotease [Gammaproteobacteria bacterium]